MVDAKVDGRLPASLGRLAARIVCCALLLVLVAAPSARADDYRLGPSDRLRIKVYQWSPSPGEVSQFGAINDEFGVGADGSLSLPFVGQLDVDSMQASDVAGAIVGLVQVLIRDPRILLMDEPFGPLDAQTRQIMGNLLLDLWSAARKAVLFVTHDLEEAIALSDRVVIMSAGPAARIIGDWEVALPRPRDIAEVKVERAFQELHREIWAALKTEVLKGYAQTGGG